MTATALAGFLSSVSIFGLDRVVMRYVPEGRLKASAQQLTRFINRLSNLRLLAVTIPCVGVALAWGYVGPLFNVAIEGLMLPVLLFACVHAFVLFHTVMMQSLMLQEDLRRATTLIWFVRLSLVVTAVAVLPRLDAVAALWLTLTSEALGWLWMTHTIRTHCRVLCQSHAMGYQDTAAASPGKGGIAWPGDFATVLRFGWHNYLMGQLSFPTHARVQQLIVAALFSPDIVAAFGFFRNLSEQVRNYLPLQLLKALAEPVMMGRYVQTGDFASLNAMGTAMLKVNILVIAPFCGWLFVAGEPAIAFLTGGKFIGETWILVILVASQVVLSAVSLLIIAANAIGISHRLPIATALGMLATVSLLWSQFPLIGIAALVLSDLVFGTVTCVVIVRAMRHKGAQYEWSAKLLARMGIVAGVVTALGWWAMAAWGNQQPTLAAMILAGLMVMGYWGLCILWKPLYERERILLHRLAGPKLIRW
jgi:O-antigen/teichoic acid export membrane protein